MTFDTLKKLFAQMMENEDLSNVTSETRLKEDLGITSLYMMWLAYAIESEFGISLADIDVEQTRTVGDICDYIDKKKANETL